MNSKALRSFWNSFYQLPKPVQELARSKFALWRENPFHPSLQFKELRPTLWSARINDNYRALARRRGGQTVWFWIGTHADYDGKI